MEFTIKSKCNVGDKIPLIFTAEKATVIDIELRQATNGEYNIMCLVEYPDRSRNWKADEDTYYSINNTKPVPVFKQEEMFK